MEDDRGEGLGISGDDTRPWLDVARERDRRRRRDRHAQRDCVVVAAGRACLGQKAGVLSIRASRVRCLPANPCYAVGLVRQRMLSRLG